MAESLTVPATAGTEGGQLVSVGSFAAKNIVAAVPELQKIKGIEVKIEAAIKNEVDMVATHMSLVVGDLQAQAESELLKIKYGFRWAQTYPVTASLVAGALVTIGVLIGYAI